MRISDWSSDVCSSDLTGNHRQRRHEHQRRQPPAAARIGLLAQPVGARQRQFAEHALPYRRGCCHPLAHTVAQPPPCQPLPCVRLATLALTHIQRHTRLIPPHRAPPPPPPTHPTPTHTHPTPPPP